MGWFNGISLLGRDESAWVLSDLLRGKFLLGRGGGGNITTRKENTPGEQETMAVLNRHFLALDIRLAANAEGLLGARKHHDTSGSGFRDFFTLYFVVCFLLPRLLLLLLLQLLLLLLTFSPFLPSPRGGCVTLPQIIVIPRRAWNVLMSSFPPSLSCHLPNRRPAPVGLVLLQREAGLNQPPRRIREPVFGSHLHLVCLYARGTTQDTDIEDEGHGVWRPKTKSQGKKGRKQKKAKPWRWPWRLLSTRYV